MKRRLYTFNIMSALCKTYNENSSAREYYKNQGQTESAKECQIAMNTVLEIMNELKLVGGTDYTINKVIRAFGPTYEMEVVR